ncbi:hypothetical protein K438DRAFT_1651237, partial [Mycena galopus ATCC 62051]
MSHWNSSFRFGGPQTDARATLFGILHGVKTAPKAKDLIITTSSEYAIRSICYWAGDNATLGWCGRNGDVLKEIAKWIYLRSASVEFRWAPATNHSLVAAKALARDSLNLTSPALIGLLVLGPVPQALPLDYAEVLDTQKVFTSLPEVPPPKAHDIPTLTIDEVADPEDAHRGRQREREMVQDNLNKLLACETNLDFWTLVRKWTDDRPVEPRVTPAELHGSFSTRLNPPDDIPDHFDAELNEIMTGLAATIPTRTQDRTPQGFFSRDIT